MAKEEVMLQFLHCSLILSAMVSGVVGWHSGWSVKKMVVSYGAGVLFAMCIVVPDWHFFLSRPPSEWSIPMASDPQSAIAQKARFDLLDKDPHSQKRLNFYPLRILMFVVFYSSILFIIWKYISS